MPVIIDLAQANSLFSSTRSHQPPSVTPRVNGSVSLTTLEHLFACQVVTGSSQPGDNHRRPVDNRGGLWTTVRTINDESGIVHVSAVVGIKPCVDWHRTGGRRFPHRAGDVDGESTSPPGENGRNDAPFPGFPHIPTPYYQDGFSLFKRKKNGDTVCLDGDIASTQALSAPTRALGITPEHRRGRPRHSRWPPADGLVVDRPGAVVGVNVRWQILARSPERPVHLKGAEGVTPRGQGTAQFLAGPDRGGTDFNLCRRARG